MENRQIRIIYSLDFHFVRVVVQRQQMQVGHTSFRGFHVLQLDEHFVVLENFHRRHVSVQTEQIKHAIAVDRWSHVFETVHEQYFVGSRSATPQRVGQLVSRWTWIAATKSGDRASRPFVGVSIS